MAIIKEISDEKLDEIRGRVEAGRYDFKYCATRIERRLYVEDVVAAIFETNGHLGSVSSLLGFERHRVKSYINKSTFLLTLLENEDETLIDDSREIIANHVRDKKNPYIALQILKTLGKDRGYTTRIESTGKDGGPIKTENADPRQQLKDVLEDINKKEKELAAAESVSNDEPVPSDQIH